MLARVAIEDLRRSGHGVIAQDLHDRFHGDVLAVAAFPERERELLLADEPGKAVADPTL